MNTIRKALVLAGLLRRKLTFFTWNVSNLCNEKCPMCEVIRRRSRDLSLDEIREILPQFRAAGFLSVGVTGGEPFLRKDIFEILGLLDELGFLYTVATNGTLVTDEVARRVASLRNLLQIAVSIDSLDAERFALLRGKPLLDEAIAGLDRLIAARPAGTVKVNFVMSRQNAFELDELIAFTGKKRVYLTVIPVVAGTGGLIHRRDDPVFDTEEEDRRVLGDAFERLAALRRRGVHVWDASGYHEMAAGLARGRLPGPCDAGRIVSELRADGGIAVCPDQEPFASLREMSLAEALAKIPGEQEAIRRCYTEHPCLYTCTYGISAIARHPLRHALEQWRVTRGGTVRPAEGD